MTQLEAFLSEKPVSTINYTVKLGGRLEKMTFKIKAITSERYKELQRLCTVNANDPNKSYIDFLKLTATLIAECCVDPNFHDLDFQKKLNANTGVEAVQKCLMIGELNQLGESILRLLGLKNEELQMEQGVDFVKNS